MREARTRDERVKRGDFAASIDSARASEADVVAADQRVTEARAAIDRARSAARIERAASLALHDRFLVRLRTQLAAAVAAADRARAAHDGVTAQVDIARRTLARARADREVIERHFAHWRVQQRKLADRRED